MKDDENVMALLDEFDIGEEKPLIRLSYIEEKFNEQCSDRRFYAAKVANKLFEVLRYVIRSVRIRIGQFGSVKSELEEEINNLEKKRADLERDIASYTNFTRRLAEAKREKSTLACVVVRDLPPIIAKRIMDCDGEYRDDELLAIIEELDEKANK